MTHTTQPERNSRHSLVRAAIYARVSTASNGQDPSMQTREIREYANGAAVSLQVNTWTWGSRALRRNVRSSIG
jgi:predicted site-specific integrase-resolvase